MLNKTLITIIYNISSIKKVMLLNNIKVMMIKKIHRKTTNNVVNNEIRYQWHNMKHYKYNIKTH